MSRPVDWTPLAESDPAPGDADRLESGARHYAKVAAAIELAAKRLGRITAGLDAQSKAVEALRASSAEVGGDISRAHERYAGVAAALTDFLPTLNAAQEQSLTLLQKARTAESALQDAERLAAEARARAAAAPPGLAEVDLYEGRRLDGLALAAQQDITTARKAVADLAAEVAQARRRAVLRIRDVHGSGGLKDGWRDNFGGWVNQHIAPILPALNKVSAALGAAALVLAWVPFLGPALGTAALIVAGVGLLANLSMSVGKEAGWGPSAIAAVGLASFGLAKLASARYVTAAGGARGASRRLAGQLASRSPAARRGLNLPDDASSARAIERMMGQVHPLSRNQARGLLDDAANSGVIPAAGKVLRDLPGQMAKDLKEARHFRPHHLDDLPPTPGRIFGLMGERGMGVAGANLHTIHPAIRESAQVGQHLKTMEWSAVGVAAGFSGGAGAWGFETLTMDNAAAGADQLNLSERGPLEAAGR